jgi:hypothetical protein
MFASYKPDSFGVAMQHGGHVMPSVSDSGVVHDTVFHKRGT